MNRIDRLVAIVLFLQGRRVSRAEDIAGHFEISLRTVYRDIAALGEAGVPILGEAGVGYSLFKGYHLPPVTFTPEEASALATGGVLVERWTDPSLAGPMRSALLKIRAVLSREQQERVARVEGATLFQGGGEDVRGETTAQLLQIQAALAERRVLRLLYRSGSKGEVTRRDVEPLGLVHYLQHWHLIAWCRLRGDYRDFRLDRVESLAVDSGTFLPRETFDLRTHLQQVTSPDATVQIQVLFRNGVARRARREWSLGVVSEEPTPEGAVLTLSAAVLDWFVGWLLSFGADAVVLSPEELRLKLVAAAEAAAQHHRRPGQSF